MLKRIFDICASSLGLVVCAPVLLIVSLLIRCTLGSPIFFRQFRPGLHGKPFEMVKFRTMKDTVDAKGKPLPDSERMTPLGQLLRASSLDELPELWNVLKGEMSLVGPRPLLVRYMAYFTPVELERFNVRPGITGWAQVHGRNQASWDDRLGLDVWYVRNRSFLLDCKIILMTLRKVLTKDGVVVDPSLIMLDLDEERREKTEK